MEETVEHVVGFSVSFALKIATDYYQGKFYQTAHDILSQIRIVVPNDLDAAHLFALCTAALGDYKNAISLLEQVVAHAEHNKNISPKVKASYLINLCSFYERNHRYAEATALGRKAEALVPEDTVLLHNLGVAAFHHRRYEESVEYARRAVALAPKNGAAHMLLAEGLLAQGYFEEGWAEYAWRFYLDGASVPEPKLSLAAWKGEHVDGRIMVVADQGYGDVFFFWRYIWRVAKYSPLPLAISAPKEILPVLAKNAPPGTVGFGEEIIDRLCCWVPLSELPRIFGAGIKPDSIPNQPYLKPDEARRVIWAGKLPKAARRIGLCWAGRKQYINDTKRSMPIEALFPLVSFSNTCFISLQKGDNEKDCDRWPGQIFRAGELFEDWLDTQACIANLDLVICVDTGIAHLAAAMGKPVWLMVPYASEWRWGKDAIKTPWYPSVTLWRQDQPADWQGVIERICNSL